MCASVCSSVGLPNGDAEGSCAIMMGEAWELPVEDKGDLMGEEAKEEREEN